MERQKSPFPTVTHSRYNSNLLVIINRSRRWQQWIAVKILLSLYYRVYLCRKSSHCYLQMATPLNAHPVHCLNICLMSCPSVHNSSSSRHAHSVISKCHCGPDSSVGIATGYGLYRPEIESRWGRRDFPHLSRPALGPAQTPVQRVPGISGG